MKKTFIILSALLLLSFNMNNLAVKAAPLNIQLTEGVHSVKDLKLVENKTYKIQNTSAGTILMMRIDGDQQIMESHRLLENSPIYNIGPFRYVDKIVILGPGTVTITE
ncbi:hypothetical protein [Clostridium beijerinckii]|uniref:Uncharacterized protein n=1 Tax=Clostridium beijerinckii TaxID=1520 RepID=A0AAX0B2K0_CLOBE|nr:hypothetical protein [Clostridium beijerinckii]NRT89464.1 hypothetical protein [Clostridium beijerinckii]NYC74920.1 hypothetical protein [Clostridium beijerinckii]